MQIWPLTVTTVALANTWQETPERNVADFPVEIGSPKERRRSSVATRQVQFKIPALTSAEMTDLLDWYEYALLDGVLPFLRPNVRTGTWQVFRFMAAPQGNEVGGKFLQVSIQLRKEP